MTTTATIYEKIPKDEEFLSLEEEETTTAVPPPRRRCGTWTAVGFAIIMCTSIIAWVVVGSFQSAHNSSSSSSSSISTTITSSTSSSSINMLDDEEEQDFSVLGAMPTTSKEEGSKSTNTDSTSTTNENNKAAPPPPLPTFCTFDECFSSNCNQELDPFTCLRNNGGPHGGCSTIPWMEGTCEKQCDLTGCSALPIPEDLDDCNVPCDEAWCEGVGERLCPSPVSYQCSVGSAAYGCSDDHLQWTLRTSSATCSSCCNTDLC